MTTDTATVITVLQVLQDEWLTPLDQCQICLELFLGRAARKIPSEDSGKILEQILDELFGKAKKTSGPRALDFILDSPYIYSAFKQTYNIDLMEASSRLPWKVFLQLFADLPDATIIKRIIAIRVRPIPAITQYNKQEVMHLMEQKTKYALPMSEEERENAFQAGVDKLVNSLQKLAKAGEQ